MISLTGVLHLAPGSWLGVHAADEGDIVVPERSFDEWMEGSEDEHYAPGVCLRCGKRYRATLAVVDLEAAE